MDPKLAELYGTNAVDENDIEKLAAAQLAEELGEGQELDINDLSPEDIEAMASEVLASEGGGEDVEEPGDDAQEKLAEADHLGRVMAHAYVQELKGIEKDAGAYTGKAKNMGDLEMRENAMKKRLESKRNAKGSSHMSLGERAHSTARSAGLRAKALGSRAAEGAKQVGFRALSGARYAGDVAKKHPKTAIGAGVVSALGAGYAAGHKKHASALDTLAGRRALEILEANGIDPESLTQAEPEQVKTSAPEVLDQAVNARAAELLAQFGLTVEE